MEQSPDFLLKQFSECLSEIKSTYSDVFNHKTKLGVAQEDTADNTDEFKEGVRRDVAGLYVCAMKTISYDVEGDDAKKVLDGLKETDPLVSCAGLSLDGVYRNHDAVRDYLEESFDEPSL